MTQLTNSDTYVNLSPIAPEPQESNGLFYNRSTGNVEMLIDGTSIATFSSQGPQPVVASPAVCSQFEDFLGNTINNWLTTKDTSAAGSPTLATVDDADCGHFKMGFDATDEAQILTLYSGDNQQVDPNAAAQFYMRLSVSATPNANDILVFGLASAQNNTADTVASNFWLRLQGASLTPVIESDDGSTDNDDKATDQSFVMVAGTMYEFRFDIADDQDCAVYYRSTLGGAWTELTTSGTTFKINSTTGIQPFVQLQKSGGTQTTFVLVDYVQAIFNRS